MTTKRSEERIERVRSSRSEESIFILEPEAMTLKKRADDVILEGCHDEKKRRPNKLAEAVRPRLAVRRLPWRERRDRDRCCCSEVQQLPRISGGVE